MSEKELEILKYLNDSERFGGVITKIGAHFHEDRYAVTILKAKDKELKGVLTFVFETQLNPTFWHKTLSVLYYFLELAFTVLAICLIVLATKKWFGADDIHQGYYIGLMTAWWIVPKLTKGFNRITKK